VTAAANKKRKRNSSGSLHRVVRRFFATDKELAETVANDIAEDIDCGETREQLRVAIQFWAAEAAREAQERAALESQITIYRSAKALMDVALSSNHVI
jgi:hypothetical protein